MRSSSILVFMAITLQSDQKIRDALSSIIEGKIVKRIKHELRHEGKDLTAMFIEELERHGYRATTVDQVNVQPGERVPAFYIDNGNAYFGWVFWEQFTSWKIRKLWGSVIKNKRGDWDMQIPATRNTIIYANELLKLEMDIDHPPEF
ncbi:MAG: hypothetical protein HY707_01820 [Ignavibacteriae bacterium]|nr:hypothetical protein [Ignavibacteriota bacterium]